MKLLNRSINAFSPEIQSPVQKSALHFVDMRVFDNNRPSPDPGFSPKYPLELNSRKKTPRDLPMSNGHKGPVFIPTFEGIVCSIRSDMAHNPFWTSEFDAQIASPSV